MLRFRVVAGFFLWSIFSLSLSGNDSLRYSKKPTVAGDYDPEHSSMIAYKDSLPDDSLFLVRIKGDTPLHYFKPITTEVCFDNECRLLNITVYWNITGRYLGFELSDGEFLSKRDHEPFSDSEYKKLNDLLADPSLPLGQVSFEALIKAPEADSVDAVSGATTADVAQMVVKGAAYTTYTLWNIVHGPTADRVAGLTEKQLTPDLIDLILKSPDISDRVWALKRITEKTVFSPKLSASLLDLIAGDDFYLAYSAVRAIKATHLREEALQVDLYAVYPEAGHSIKNMITEKLMEAPYLSPEVILSSRKSLDQLNGKQLSDLLKLYGHHGVHDLETCKAVAEILKNENRFVARQAYQFLKKLDIAEGEITTLLAEYEQK